MYKKSIIYLILLFNLQILLAQNSNQKTSDIQINVLTESLEKTKNPQQLSLEINKNTLTTPGYLSINFENVDAILTLVTAKLNNQELWLINNSTSANNDKVLAWNFDKDSQQLYLYPHDLNSTYILEINIQVNFKNVSAIENQQSATIILTSEISGQTFEALPTGNGSEIQLS